MRKQGGQSWDRSKPLGNDQCAPFKGPESILGVCMRLRWIVNRSLIADMVESRWLSFVAAQQTKVYSAGRVNIQ